MRFCPDKLNEQCLTLFTFSSNFSLHILKGSELLSARQWKYCSFLRVMEPVTETAEKHVVSSLVEICSLLLM